MAKVTNDGVICYAHPMTVGQFNRMEKKDLDAFKIAPLSKRAKEEGAYMGNDSDNGYCYTTSAWQGFSADESSVFSVANDGGLGWDNNNDSGAGLRVALHPTYDPQSKIVKTERSESKTANVYDDYEEDVVVKTSTGTIVTVGGIDYLWLNKEECENGTEKTMDLVSVEIVACSVPFDREGKHNDYAKATELQQQCEEVALGNCNEEELSLIQAGLLSKEDCYENWTPLAMQRERPKHIKEVYLLVEYGELTPEEGKQALQAILDEIKKENGSAEEIKKFTQNLEAEHKIYMERKAAREAEEREKQEAYDAAKSTIEGLDFGGDQQ